MYSLASFLWTSAVDLFLGRIINKSYTSFSGNQKAAHIFDFKNELPQKRYFGDCFKSITLTSLFSSN